MPEDPNELAELSQSELIELLRRGVLAQEQQDELERCRQAQSDQRELPFGDDLHHDLSRTGWGVLWLEEEAPRLRQSLEPLLAHRRRQAGTLYRELSCKPFVLPRQFFADHGVAPGTIDPQRLPYFLLLVGDPERIPFELQYQLSINRAVGRLFFSDSADYERYAKAVVQAELGGVDLPRRGVLFEVRNDDRATDLLAAHLVAPLADQLPEITAPKGWEIDVWRRQQAKKEALARLLGGGQTPGWLLTACHGKRCQPGDAEQESRQGALICEDWPGPKSRQASTPEEFFDAADLPAEARVDGLIAFFCACYGAGTPLVDNFPHETPAAKKSDRPLALPAQALTPRPFVARLPQALLARGALAVVGHVDRGWTLSFSWVEKGRLTPAVETLRDVLARLVSGHRLGHALRPLHRRYAALAAMLADPLERLRGGEKVDEAWLALQWTAHNDARNFIVLGDPAVYLLGRPNRAAATTSPAKDEASATTNAEPPLPEENPSSRRDPSAEARGSDLPDLLLAVREERSRDGIRLHFQATVHDASLSWNQRSFPSKVLRHDAQEYFEGHFRDLEALTFDNEERRFEARKKVESLGVAVFEELLPRDLRLILVELWRRWSSDPAASAPTLQILSQETWIPWQLLKLQDPADQTAAGPFLAEAFAMTRWLEGDEVPLDKVLELPLERLALIVPDDSGLAHAQEEGQVIDERLTAAGRQVKPIAATFRDVLGSLASGQYQGWHLTGHGFAWGKIPDGWGLQLANGGILRAVDLRGDARGLGKARPLIFLNACHSGHGGASLGRLGGFAATFLELGAGAFIGASWAAQDRAAVIFARMFYSELLAGAVIGEAVRRARLVVRDACPGDPTWLAYSAYAHPLASCRAANTGAGSSGLTTGPQGEPTTEVPRVDPPDREPRLPKPRSRWSTALVGFFVAVVIFGSLFAIPWTTPVRLDLVVERLRFTVSGTEARKLIDGTVSWRSLMLNDFSRIELERPAAIEISDNGSDWQASDTIDRIVLTARSNLAQATLEGTGLADSPASLGTLNTLWVDQGAKVVLAIHPAGTSTVDLTVELDPAPPHLDISLPDRFQLDASAIAVEGLVMPSGSASRFFLRGEPAGDGSSFKVSSSGLLSLIATVNKASISEPLLRNALPIVDLELFELSGRNFETVLRGDGNLSYPEQPWRRDVSLSREDLVGLESSQDLDLSLIELAPEKDALRIILNADASKIRSGPASDRSRDHRLRLGEVLFGESWGLWLLVCGLAGAGVGLLASGMAILKGVGA